MIRLMDPVGGGVPLWEEQALERSLGPARARSAALVRRLVDAARALAADVGPDFTVPQVAAKAGVSLKTLYRCFSGKDALLLAVFEEDNRAAADVLAGMMAGSDDPLERLRAFITGLFELSTASPSEGYILLVMREYFRLAQHHSEGVEHVLSPFVDLLAAELERADDAGVVRLRDARRDATAVFLLAISHVCPLVLADEDADSPATARFVADFALSALGAGG
jgi:AcrR family transcriptional regulator